MQRYNRNKRFLCTKIKVRVNLSVSNEHRHRDESLRDSFIPSFQLGAENREKMETKLIFFLAPNNISEISRDAIFN